MDWSATHADYVIATYAFALITVLWCIGSTWHAARRRKAADR